MEHLHDESIQSMLSLTPLQSWAVILMVLILPVIVLFEMRIASQPTALDEGELPEADEPDQRPHLRLLPGGLDPDKRPYDWAVDGL